MCGGVHTVHAGNRRVRVQQFEHLPPSRVGQHAAVEMANAAVVTTRLMDARSGSSPA